MSATGWEYLQKYWHPQAKWWQGGVRQEIADRDDEISTLKTRIADLEREQRELVDNRAAAVELADAYVQELDQRRARFISDPDARERFSAAVDAYRRAKARAGR